MKKIKCFIYDNICFIIPLAILFTLLVTLIVFCIYSYNIALQNGVEDYNNGICKECGEPFEYKGSSRDKHYRYDYYICSNGHVIEVFKG